MNFTGRGDGVRGERQRGIARLDVEPATVGLGVAGQIWVAQPDIDRSPADGEVKVLIGARSTGDLTIDPGIGRALGDGLGDGVSGSERDIGPGGDSVPTGGAGIARISRVLGVQREGDAGQRLDTVGERSRRIDGRKVEPGRAASCLGNRSGNTTGLGVRFSFGGAGGFRRGFFGDLGFWSLTFAVALDFCDGRLLLAVLGAHAGRRKGGQHREEDSCQDEYGKEPGSSGTT